MGKTLRMTLPCKARPASLLPNFVFGHKKGRQGWDKPAFIKGEMRRACGSSGKPGRISVQVCIYTQNWGWSRQDFALISPP